MSLAIETDHTLVTSAPVHRQLSTRVEDTCALRIFSLRGTAMTDKFSTKGYCYYGTKSHYLGSSN